MVDGEHIQAMPVLEPAGSSGRGWVVGRSSCGPPLGPGLKAAAPAVPERTHEIRGVSPAVVPDDKPDRPAAGSVLGR